MFFQRLLTGPACLAAWQGRADADPRAVAAELTRLGDDPGAVPDMTPFDALAATVDFAMYWQEPDALDRTLAADEVREALTPVARRVAAAAPSWWSSAIALDRQRLIERLDPDLAPPSLCGLADALASWRAETRREEEQADERPRDVRVHLTANWWSAPNPSALPATTRALPGIGAVGLALVEDGLGWTAGRCIPVAPTDEPRIFEINGPHDWVELVTRYPLEVTLSRRHDW